jgi:hypothetical protein
MWRRRWRPGGDKVRRRVIMKIRRLLLLGKASMEKLLVRLLRIIMPPRLHHRAMRDLGGCLYPLLKTQVTNPH